MSGHVRRGRNKTIAGAASHKDMVNCPVPGCITKMRKDMIKPRHYMKLVRFSRDLKPLSELTSEFLAGINIPQFSQVSAGYFFIFFLQEFFSFIGICRHY